MDYFEIVIKGFFRNNNRKYLKQYFLREFKKAEREYYHIDEFFDGLLSVVANFKDNLQQQIIDRKKELNLILDAAINGELKYTDLKSETLKQKRLETIEFCEKELVKERVNGLGSETFYVNFFYLTNGKISYLMRYEEIQEIRQAILNALLELKDLDKIDLFPKENNEIIKVKEVLPNTFEELFFNPDNVEPCLNILRELQPPVIDAMNNYIGKAKGVFPLWIKVLKNHSPTPLIKHFKDTLYKDLLNKKIKGLKLSKDASEFRKQYKRLEKNKVESEIKIILSQYSQSGKLGN
ncbi:hypothetical protein [Seonamhaeicola maritimus]|uniref:hypothetical protein n=1 Tax=Seonamhaeicola maritimus TaxID=2591822 RepID=UPI0024945680|nr:hypothetical protein [Seonamhaeicola maritimus]